MVIDAHVHIWGFPSFMDLDDKIRTTEDLIAFRTRYPQLYQARLTETPVDNTDQLVADMGRNGVAKAIVQAAPGYITNQQVVAAARRYPDRLIPLLRLGHDQEAAGYLEDPTPAREQAPEEIVSCIEQLGVRGVGETFVRALTNEIHPEKIARDLAPIMETLARYRLPILFPTAWSQFPGALYYGNPIFVDEVAARFPQVPIVLTKMGRGIQTYFDMALTVALRNVNVYFDTVGTTGAHLRQAIDRIGAERIMFGTDWSATWRWVREPQNLHALRMKALDEAQLSESEREQILWKTASRLFRLDE
ncbi:MAG: amidohydrolase [Chloroflexi bacterium]|nr:amidohydrolase [Chloroflexota bacterium]